MKNICPISSIMIDENAARLVGFFVLILLLIGIWYPVIYIFIFAEFILKSIKFRYSSLSWLAKKILHKILKIKIKPTGAAPKRFAARLGLVFSTLILIALFFELQLFFYIILVMFIFAAFLETFFNYCLGCKIYSILIHLKKR